MAVPVRLLSTTDVEVVAKYAARMLASSYVHLWAKAPFIRGYVVDLRVSKFFRTRIGFPSGEEQVARLVAYECWVFSKRVMKRVCKPCLVSSCFTVQI